MKFDGHYGYYVFLGFGDFDERKYPPPLGPEWTSTWDCAEWKRRVDRLAALGTDTLFIYLMGHRLPYRSEKFPDCVETGHPNVKQDFLQQVMDHALGKGMELVAVFTTTGHARGYAATRPDLLVHDPPGTPQRSGMLCHNKPGAREYPVGVFQETLTRYRGFSGVILHPPEFSRGCHCKSCRELYARERGRPPAQTEAEEVRAFFMRTNMLFQRTVLEPEIRRLLPGARQFTFTIPWIFEKHFEDIAQEIPRETTIVEWDYDWRDEAIEKLPARLKRYAQFGHALWFMPTSGYSFSKERSPDEQAAAVRRQVGVARGAGIKDVIYFLGPTWWPTVEATACPPAAGT